MRLLDTNTCIQLLNGKESRVSQRFALQAPHEIALSSVVKAELLYGARHSMQVEENLSLLRSFFAPLVSLPFDDRCAEEYGQIRADLRRQGRPIGPNDLLIAATARAFDAILVTHNTTEFGRVAGLRMEDWEESTPL
jgi:tRNA(fMet)-specific endonuclease VapC